jgi:hypothetical protein
MENSYGIFLTIELARCMGLIDPKLEYDLTWETGKGLYYQYEGGEFDNNDESEYDCIHKFLKNMILHGKILEELEELGLTVSGKPISKTAFKKLGGVHQYNSGKKMLNVIFFYKNSKELLYGFYPTFKGETKADCINSAYERLTGLVGGDMVYVNEDYIQRGNSGIPIAYRNIYIR